MSRFGGDPDETDLSDDVREARRPPTEAVPAPKRATESAVSADQVAASEVAASVPGSVLRRYGPALAAAVAAALIVVIARSRR